MFIILPNNHLDIIGKFVQPFFNFGIGVSLSLSMVEHTPHFLHLVAMLKWNLNEHWYSNCNWMVVYSYDSDKMKYLSNSHAKIIYSLYENLHRLL